MSNTEQTNMVPLDLRDVQTVGLDILLGFDAFCKKHGLRYYLCGGTLLGAVRHQGFIPWDDDVDVFMARPDYDRMIKICETESIREDLQLACLQNGRLPRPFSKIYHMRTKVSRRNHKDIAGNHVWIDVLPVDGLPSDEKKLKRLFFLHDILDRINFDAMWIVGRGPRRYVLKKLTYYPLAVLVGAKGWASMLDRIGRSRPYENSPTVGTFVSGVYGVGEAMPHDKFEIPAKVTFEGREYETMSCYKEYLSGIYGDYMTPPPANKRYGHMKGAVMSKEDYDWLYARYPERKPVE